jgi:hypothetical protein
VKVTFVNDLGEAAVFRIESESRPSRYHYVMKLREGGMICTCEGWQYNGHCKHLEQIPDEELRKAMARWRHEG